MFEDSELDLKPFQTCRTNEGWQPILVASESTDIDHTVYVSAWNRPSESICGCPGYTYRGHCRHQEIAYGAVCRWQEGDKEQQTAEHVVHMICPRCGGPTKWEMRVDLE